MLASYFIYIRKDGEPTNTFLDDSAENMLSMLNL